MTQKFSFLHLLKSRICTTIAVADKTSLKNHNIREPEPVFMYREIQGKMFNILVGDSSSHCEKKKDFKDMYLFLNGYQDRAV
jgi:hypothetical protein